MVEYVKYEEENKGQKEKYKVKRFGKFTISNIEIYHLIGAFLISLLTINILLSKSGFFFTNMSFVEFFNFKRLSMVGIAFGLGFIIHEFAHKFVAQHYGHVSEFRADFKMMFIILGLAFISPFLILAPGAVLIIGRVTRKQNGIISLAGPFSNLVIAFISFILLFFSTYPSYFYDLFRLIFIVNVILGAFNMLPFGPLDGRKIMEWDPRVFYIFFGIFAFLVFFSFKIF